MFPLFSGSWSNGTKREFYETISMPDDKSCISASGIFFYGDKVVLVKNKRGWEIPGGHREEGESIKDTLVREMNEEIGINLELEKDYKVWGYRKVTSTIPLSNRKGGLYPFPNYLITYIGKIENSPLKPIGHDVVSTGLFSYDEIVDSDFIARDIILYAFKVMFSIK